MRPVCDGADESTATESLQGEELRIAAGNTDGRAQALCWQASGLVARMRSPMAAQTGAARSAEPKIELRTTEEREMHASEQDGQESRRQTRERLSMRQISQSRNAP